MAFVYFPDEITQNVSDLDCRNFKYYISKVTSKERTSRHNNRTSYEPITFCMKIKFKIFPALINTIKIVFRTIITVSTLYKSTRST